MQDWKLEIKKFEQTGVPNLNNLSFHLILARVVVYYFVYDYYRFTRPENLGSESKIKCNKCRSYQVCAYKTIKNCDFSAYTPTCRSLLRD